MALVASKKRPVPDLIVSVLNPSRWQQTLSIKCSHVDQPGVVSKAINAASTLNIALAESVTIEAGGLHEITLFCEHVGNPKRPLSKAQLIKTFRQLGFERNIVIDRFEEREVLWIQRGVVESGWIKNVNWRDEISTGFGKEQAKIDFSKAVVSADTTNRLLRFTFPYKNAKTIRVGHLDQPRVLKQITDVLFEGDLNLLSMLLRPGGARPGNAMLVAICEPKGGVEVNRSYDQVYRGLKQLPPALMTDVIMHDGIDASRTIVPREPGTVIAAMPSNLVEKSRQIKSSFIPAGKSAIFFSRRFVADSRATLIADSVRKAVAENSCNILEASPEDDVSGPNLIFVEVSAKMWVADAGIILVTGLKVDEPLGRNLPYESGFLQGQTKPILLLVESGLQASQTLWSNIDGVYAPRFPSDEIAFLADRSGSIHDIVTKWIRRVRQVGLLA